MIICENCGSENNEGSKFCRNCGSELKLKKETIEENEFKFCPNCGFKMNKSLNFCPECGTSTNPAVQRNTNSVVNSNKSPLLAAILSFLIIGLGQVYLGLTKKGIILFFAAIASGILMMILIGWITWLIVYGYAVYDAYNSAQKMNNGIAVPDTIDFDNLF